MTAEKIGLTRRPLDDWLTNRLRLTVFPATHFDAKNENWFAQLVGMEPERVERRPAQAQVSEVGPFEAGRLVVAAQPIRIDLGYVPSEANEQEEQFPSVGTFRESVGVLRRVAREWFEISPTPKRIALGVTLQLPVRDRDEGYVQLAAYLPSLELRPDRDTDLLFRINRRRASKTITGLQVNRLCTWAVVITKLASVTIQPQVAPETVVSVERTACQMEADINSDALYDGTFNRDQLLGLFDEFSSLAEEIAVQGDIP